MKAKEKLGKTSSIRNQPDVSGGKVGEIAPRSTISFIEIVPGGKQPLDSWLKLRDGQFVNLKVAGIEYYDIISNPTPDPEPDGVVTVTLNDSRTGETWSGILSKQ